ncbi:MAG: antibiotic biosynthesis monooxygenase [Acidobacteriota bacterium]
MFIALYHWKLKPGQERRFQEGWHRRTQEIYQKCGSLGSRLHRGEDGTWYAYAQWPDKQTWEAAGKIPVEHREALVMMQESIEQTYPSIYLDVVDDLLQQTAIS